MASLFAGKPVPFARCCLAAFAGMALACAVVTAAPHAAWAAGAQTEAQGEVAASSSAVELMADGGSDKSWYDEGKDAYTLIDAPDLRGFSELVNGGVDFAGKTVTFEPRLSSTSAIVSLKDGFTPIGTAAHPFCGTFDGQGLEIVDLSLTSGTDGVGLFGYAGEGSSISNVSVSGNITLTVSAKSGAIVKNVGGVAGSTQGSLSACTSSVEISIDSATQATEKNPFTVSRIGGVVGYVAGDVDNCAMRQSGSVRVESTSKPVSVDIPWVAGYVGGVVGQHGPLPDDPDDTKDDGLLKALGNPSTISNCTNAADVRVLAYQQGENDRFGNETFAASRFLGGIVGYTAGNVTSCKNSGHIDSAKRGADGAAANAMGCTATGGIVGAMRTDVKVEPAQDGTDPGKRYNAAKLGTAIITLSSCENTGDVFGMAQVGGIVGYAGSYTTVTASSNTGDVEGSRYTKPSPGGIAGRAYGTVSYCYNTGDIKSTTGAGYYAGGVVGQMHSVGRDVNDDKIEPEMYACYNTGYVITDSNGYRSGSLVGELMDGTVHDCFSLEKRVMTASVSGLSNPTGTFAKSAKEISEKSLNAATSVALLNACCDKDGWQVYYALPEGATWGTTESGVHPVLVGESYGSARDLAGLSGAEVETASDARYSSFMDPVPAVAVSAGGAELVQNADFRVVAQAGTAGSPAGTTGLTATIAGIGNYRGELSAKATYSIDKGDLSTCTVSAESKFFNFEKQRPTSVTVFDEAGNVVDSSEYTWDVDAGKWAQESNLAGTPYLDAQTSSATEGYPIIVTAAADGNYEGKKEENCFKIKTVPFASNNALSNPNQDKLVFGDIEWGKQHWKLADVQTENRGVMKVTYTGSPITPTITGISYMGHKLTEIHDGDKYYENPYAWGYQVLYGNPNPEESSTDEASSYLENVTNATAPGEYAVMTIRSAPMSNFDNYLSVWFTIEPANMASTSAKLSKSVYTYDGKAKKPSVTVKFNGKTLKAGTDYTLTYKNNKAVGKASVTLKGKGNFKGSKTLTFKINPKATSVSKLTAASKAFTVKYKKISGVTGYQVRYAMAKSMKGAQTKNVKGASKTSLKVSKLKSGKTYYVQVRTYKKVGATTYYSGWSTAKKVKVK